MKLKPENLLLYAITDRRWAINQTFYEQIEAALSGGITMLQLREKNLNKKLIIEEASKIKQMCKSFNVPLIINDDLDIALEVQADGVHVGLDDLPVDEIRKKTGENFIIGATAKTISQAQEAELNGADYLGVGAVFPSHAKPNAIRVDKIQLKNICKSVKIPVIAIGGIGLENISELIGSGISGVAVVSAIFSAENILKTTKILKRKAQNIINVS